MVRVHGVRRSDVVGEPMSDERSNFFVAGAAAMTSNREDWETPQSLFDALDAEHHFTLDPCSTHENAKCEKHYTKEDDGLSKSWGGKSCSAIPRMGRKSAIGARNARWRRYMVRRSCCSYRAGRTRGTSTTTCTGIRLQGSSSSRGGSSSSKEARASHRLRFQASSCSSIADWFSTSRNVMRMVMR